MIHLGPHKTGSTYLQLCFQTCRPVLRERGILFPELWEHSPGNPSQSGFAGRLAKAEFDQLSVELRALESLGPTTVLISAEDISMLDAAAFDGLRHVLEGAPVLFVFYVRRWSDLVPSGWQEQVKQGQVLTLPELVLLLVRNPETAQILNWARRLVPLIEIFGREAVRVVPYTLLRERGIDLFEHFAARFLGWPDAKAPDVAAPNMSRSAPEVEMLRALNRMALRDGAPQTSALRSRFDRRREQLDLAPVLQAMEPYRQTLMFHDDLAALGALHLSLFDSLRDLLVPPHMAQRLFAPRNVPLPYIGADYLGEPGVAEHLRRIYEAVKA